METMKCPKCGAEDHTTFVDENGLEHVCQVCGEHFGKTANAEQIEATLADIAPTPHFQAGEVMECCMCSKKQEKQPGVKSQWTYLGTPDFHVYVCPRCLQDSEQAKQGHYATVYTRVLRRYTRLRERHLRKLNN